MESHADYSGTVSPRPGKHIQIGQVVILKKIDSLGRASIIDPIVTGQISRLKQEYNALVDERARLEPSPLSDPIDRLPAELWLWPYIIKAEAKARHHVYDMHDVINMLLDLTLVSRRWRRALLSSPVLWTDIVLDQSMSDYLAKAAMCIHLSGTCEIDVYIRLSPDQWQMASSLILPESKRIRSLCLIVEVSFARTVLQEFGEMPTLRELSLYSGSGLVNEQPRQNENDLEALGLRRMPALQIPRGGPNISIDSESWRHLITYDTICMVDLTKATIEQYGKLPNFHGVMIQHRGTPAHQRIVDPELYSRTLDSSLSRVRSLTYHGPAFNRIVKWFGRDLTRLDVEETEINSIQELALSLALLQGLKSLVLSISNPKFTNKSHIAVPPLSSITDLELRFSHNFGDDTQKNWEHNAIMDSIYEALLAIVPSVTSLRIVRGLLTEACFKYIEGLANLSELDIDSCHLSRNYTVSLVAKNLRRLHWGFVGYCPTIFTDINAPSLHNLRILDTYDQFATSSSIEERGIFPCYAISGERFTRITSLTLAVVGSIRWELTSLSTLKVLKLVSPPSFGLMIWASDIIEAILMRPGDLPVLDTISFGGQFSEWDILLLMLERRILYSHFGISPIRTIIFPTQLPYKLLQPISTLLQGKLPEREPNDQFSLELVAERFYNAEIAGCRGCCHLFTHCNIRTIPGENPYEEKIMLTGLEYELPSEFLTADPPLTPDVTDWLSGKRARRRAFVQEHDRVAKKFHRAPWCDRCETFGATGVTVTGYSLGGVNFQESPKPSVD